MTTPNYPADDLRRFRYHTGAPLRPLAAGEPCPVLFRDLGLDGMQLFLEGRLRRLAGPLSPITYLRDVGYQEPYTDHGSIGRLVFLQPMQLHPWRSGVPSIFVADARRGCDPDSFGFVPGGQPGAAVARALAGAGSRLELREALGGARYDEALQDTRERIGALARSLATSEQRAGPLRGMLQSSEGRLRDRARELMLRADIDEHDLCAAWHHLPADRRAALSAGLAALDPAHLRTTG